MSQIYPGWQYQQPMGMTLEGMYPGKSVEGLVNNIAVTAVKL